jgi:hypothetical protein
MNSSLSTIDIGQFLIDEHSFLGQTIKLGIDYNLLPPNADDALHMYLQTRTMAFGQRNRTGIAIGREEMEQGVFQTTVCLEIGLLDLSEGDANRAVEQVASGDFEGLRKHGWELAFFMLKEVQDEGGLFPKRRESAFLQDYSDYARRWAHTSPETWLCSYPEDEDGPTIANPLKTYESYQDLSIRVRLLKSLPSEVLKRFGSAAGTKGPFGEVLRNMILSLFIGSDHLVATPDDVTTFVSLLGKEGVSDGGVVASLRKQIAEHGDAAAVERFVAEVRDEFCDLLALADVGLDGQFVVLSG